MIALAIAAFVVGNVFFQALFLAFPLTCRQWAWAFLVSGSLLAVILVAIIVLLDPQAGEVGERKRKRPAVTRMPGCRRPVRVRRRTSRW